MTIISVLPQNLTNGTIADASQVMANFNQIYNNVNTNATERGANSTITSLSGLTTPLSVIQGGTGTNMATGSGNAVLATSPTIVTPTLTTPTSNNGTFNSPTLVTPTLTTPTSNNGTFNSPTLVTPALGTPASGNLANCTALPASSITAGTTGAGVNITGNAATATTAASCTGNSATATTAASCTGNSATATTAASCSGNTAGSSSSCTGNSNTATTATNVSGGTVSGTIGTLTGHTSLDFKYDAGVEGLGAIFYCTVTSNVNTNSTCAASNLTIVNGGGITAGTWRNITNATVSANGIFQRVT